MTLRALTGLVALDALLLLSGYSLLFALRGQVDRRSFIRYGGLAFWLGAAAVGLVLTLLAISTAVGPRTWVVVTCALALSGAATALGACRRRRSPKRFEERGDRFDVVAAMFAAIAGLMLVALLAAAYNRPLLGWDAWAFWIPKAKALHFSGALDAEVLATFTGTTYPILVSILHAAAFGFMGSADEVSLHLQAWVFIAAFAWGVVGLLRPRVPHILIWPFVALLLALPEVSRQFVKLDGDYPSFLLFVLGALAVLRWLEAGEHWPLVAGAILLAGCASTKREGSAYVLAVAAAALLTTVRERRRRWPLIALTTAAVLATTVPWRLWLSTRAIEADTGSPESVVVEAATQDRGRFLTAADAALDFIFSYDLWSVAPWIGLLLVTAGLVLGDRRPAGFVLGATSVIFIAMVWRLLWYGGEDEPENSSIPRISATVSLLALAVGPSLALALIRNYRGAPLRAAARVAQRVPLFAAIAVATLPATGYLALGVARADFAFVDCTPAPGADSPVVVVFGRPDTWEAAALLRDRALEVGFRGTRIGFGPCGKLRVQLDDIPSAAVAEEIQLEARPVGLSPTIEGA